MGIFLDTRGGNTKGKAVIEAQLKCCGRSRCGRHCATAFDTCGCGRVHNPSPNVERYTPPVSLINIPQRPRVAPGFRKTRRLRAGRAPRKRARENDGHTMRARVGEKTRARTSSSISSSSRHHTMRIPHVMPKRTSSSCSFLTAIASARSSAGRASTASVASQATVGASSGGGGAGALIASCSGAESARTPSSASSIAVCARLSPPSGSASARGPATASPSASAFAVSSTLRRGGSGAGASSG